MFKLGTLDDELAKCPLFKSVFVSKPLDRQLLEAILLVDAVGQIIEE